MPKRLVIYLLVLLALSAVVNFHRLGEQDYYGDEGIYAYVCENMERSGDWLFFHSWDPETPYLEKPPLYFWLTTLTRDLFDDDETGSRFWSALFGIGCVLLTCLLGALLFQPEIGFLGALMLALNPNFLFVHGARHGTMDTGVTLFSLLAIVLAWRARSWMAWFLAGLCTGTVCMFKGVPYGFLMLALIGFHAMIHEKGLFLRVKGPLIGLAATLLVTLPWFIFQWVHFGHYIEQQHLDRLTGNLHPDHVQGAFFYLETITRSSGPFHLFLPAMLMAALFSFKGDKSRAFRLVLIVGAGWIAVCSASLSKLIWYVYPVYPLVALAIAALLVYPLLLLSRGRVPRLAPLIGAASLAAAVPFAMETIRITIPQYAGYYRDLRWQIYQSDAWKAASDQALFVLIESEELSRDPFRDCYVNHRMEGLVRVKTPEEAASINAWTGPLVAAVDRRAPDSLIADLDRWFAEYQGTRFASPYHIAYVRDLDVQLPEGLYVDARPLNLYYLPLGGEIAFNRYETETYLGKGWGGLEPEARWTAEPTASMRLRLEESVPLLMTMNFNTHGKQRIVVELNGTVLTTLEGDSEIRSVTVPLPVSVLKCMNDLVFRFPDARSPAESGEGEDERKLGMRVFSMRFDEGTSPCPLTADKR